MTQAREIASRFATYMVDGVVDEIERAVTRGTENDFVFDICKAMRRKEIRKFRGLDSLFAFEDCVLAYNYPSDYNKLGYHPLPPEQKASELAYLWADNDNERWMKLFSASVRLMQTEPDKKIWGKPLSPECIAAIFPPLQILNGLTANKNILSEKDGNNPKTAKMLVSALAQKVKTVAEIHGPIKERKEKERFVRNAEDLIAIPGDPRLKTQLAEAVVYAAGDDLGILNWTTQYYGFFSKDREVNEAAYCELYRRNTS